MSVAHQLIVIFIWAFRMFSLPTQKGKLRNKGKKKKIIINAMGYAMEVISYVGSRMLDTFVRTAGSAG